MSEVPPPPLILNFPLTEADSTALPPLRPTAQHYTYNGRQHSATHTTEADSKALRTLQRTAAQRYAHYRGEQSSTALRTLEADSTELRTWSPVRLVESAGEIVESAGERGKRERV